MANFLTTIARERRERLEREALHVPTVELRRQAEARLGDTRAFIASLRRPSGEPLRVIAEIKRASPSAGLLKREFDPAAIGKEYERVGAAAISVLTEPLRFQGSVEHLRAVRDSMSASSTRRAPTARTQRSSSCRSWARCSSGTMRRSPATLVSSS